MRRRAALAAAAALGALAVLPSGAAAHGLVQRADLPIPEWLFGWAAAIVLVVSFVALAVLWPAPRLQAPGWRAAPGALSRVVASRALEVACGAVGVALLGLTIWSGLDGTQVATANFAPTFVYVVVWVGFVPLSVLFGDVFRAFSPWRAIGRAAEALTGRSGRRAYPERLGYLPAAAGLLAFTWLELVYADGEVPQDLAIAAIAYTVVTLAAMARFGTEAWSERGEAFAVYFNLFSRLSPLHRRGRELGTRRVLGGLPAVPEAPFLVALLAVMIGTVTFDGFSQGSIWRDVEPDIAGVFSDLGLSATDAAQGSGTVGLLAGVAFVAAFYALGVRGAHSVGGSPGERQLRRTFVHTLVPIAVVYVLAHYLTLLVFQGQAMGYLASDPLGRGWDVFGTANSAIDYGVLSQNATWYFQVGFVVAGHVAALTLAHDRALAIYADARRAVRSQYWMLLVMVGFTTLALWLLAQANA